MSIYRYSFGLPDGEGLLALSGARVREELISSGECAYARGIRWEQVLDRFVLRFPLGRDEKLYGLGLSFHALTLKYGVRHLRCDHYGGSDNGRTHAPVPFYASDAGYGVFVDTAENISFYMGGAVRRDAENPPPEMNRGRDDGWRCEQRAEFVEASFPGHGAVVYVFTGERLRDVAAAFNNLTGGGCLPPKWALGLWHRTHIRSDEASVAKELDDFARHDLKVDVLGLEPGWQSGSYPCTLQWDRERFPDPDSFVESLRRRGVRVNLWENMYISRRSDIYGDILPFCGSHQVWGGAVPDVTLPGARDILLRQHEAHYAGVSGYKIDECDGYDEWLWPDHARFPSGRAATAVRNVYGARLARMFDDFYREKGLRTFGLARALNAGCASLPFGIYNDCYDFGQFLTGLASAGFSGVLWIPEVRDAKTPEEWIRRFQLCALSPILMLNAWASGAKPWKFPEAEEAVKAAIRLRRALTPCLYNAFYRYYSEGVPPFRPLVMDCALASSEESGRKGTLDDTVNPYEKSAVSDVTDEYMIGEDLLCAPVMPGASERDVILPPGVWYDFYTGKAYEGRVDTLPCPVDRAPLFVREGGMIPLLNGDGSLTVRCFGDEGRLSLYDDDGETLRHESGEYAVIELSFRRTDAGIEGEKKVAEHGYKTEYREIRFEDGNPG